MFRQYQMGPLVKSAPVCIYTVICIIQFCVLNVNEHLLCVQGRFVNISPIPACPNTHDSRMNSMTPQIFSMHLTCRRKHTVKLQQSACEATYERCQITHQNSFDPSKFHHTSGLLLIQRDDGLHIAQRRGIRSFSVLDCTGNIKPSILMINREVNIKPYKLIKLCI